MNIQDQIIATRDFLEQEYQEEILSLNKDKNTLLIGFSKLIKYNPFFGDQVIDNTTEFFNMVRIGIYKIRGEEYPTNLIIQIKGYSNKRTQERINEEGRRIINKAEIRLPNTGRNNRDFALDIARELEDSNELFFKPNENKIIEITEYEDKFSKKKITGFQEINTTRLANIIDQKIRCYKEMVTPGGLIKLIKTPGEQLVKYLLFNDEFKKGLYSINRLLKVRMPFIIDGKLFMPQKGYNEEIDAYITMDAAEITDMSLEEAKKIIKDVLKEFCFKEEIDRTMAIAGLITPGCRGLYERVTCRTPIFLYLANRERPGKDYLAGITGIIYEGQAINNPAISSTDKNQNNSEELRKKILSSLKNGTRRMHFQNNKGRLNNVALEAITTSEYWSDRELGKNTEITLPNEMDFSLSANIGITWTPDFWNRSRPINLFLAMENPNERIFEKPDLHGWVMKNKGLIQSSIITIIKEWFNAGSPPGNTFSSFPEWARVVGGIMNFCEFGDPCTPIMDDAVVGGDIETMNLKTLFEIMQKKQIEGIEKEHTITEIRLEIVKQQEAGQEFFGGWDFEDRGKQSSFGRLFRKYIGREFSNITLKIKPNPTHTTRDKFIFEEIQKEVAKTPKEVIHDKQKPVATSATSYPSMQENSSSSVEYIGEVPKVAKVAKAKKPLIKDIIKAVEESKNNLGIIKEVMLKLEEFTLVNLIDKTKLSRGIIQPIINTMLNAGDIIETAPGLWKVSK